jgi:hypothetical protein
MFGVYDETRKDAMNSEACWCFVLLSLFVFFGTKEMRKWEASVFQLNLHYFGHIKNSLFALEVKVGRHYRIDLNPT